MELVDLAQADISKKIYNRGMFVDFGVQYPLGDGFGNPTVTFYVLTKDNPARIAKVPVTSDDGTPPSYCFEMIFDKFDTPSLDVTFDKNEEINSFGIVVLKQSKSKRAYNTHDMWGNGDQISEPELIENVVAYVGQSNCYRSEEVSSGLLYFEEPSKENVKKALKAISQKNSYFIQIGDGDIESIVNALFTEKVSSLHEGEGMVNNGVFRNAA